MNRPGFPEAYSSAAVLVIERDTGGAVVSMPLQCAPAWTERFLPTRAGARHALSGSVC